MTVGSKRIGEVRFQAISGDHPGAPIPHLHAFFGSGEVVIELLLNGDVRLSQAHGAPIRGTVSARATHRTRDCARPPRCSDHALESESAAMTLTKSKGRVLTSTAEMQRAARDAREREKSATKILAVRYDTRRDAIIADLSTGATLIVPRRLVAGFANAAPRTLSDIAINPGGESIWSDAADDGVLLEQLLEIAAGSDFLKVLGARISGRKRSLVKAEASRANGAKGGRPPLTMTAFVKYLDQSLHALAPNAPLADMAGNPNPNVHSSALWRVGESVALYVKIHGVNEVQVQSAWPRSRKIERRIRAVADRLAREFARRLIDLARSEPTLRAVQTRALARRARGLKEISVARRHSSGRQ